ncbi:MAG: DUF6364 family protein [Gemmatimonadota bacterium]|nr:DUF6364 family protein [Gemmatimonadota bacterium]
MQSKLTLRLEARLIRRAKAYARRTGKSVSSIVADFFTRLDEQPESPDSELSPSVRSLTGALAGKRVAEEDYRKHLVEKHR